MYSNVARASEVVMVFSKKSSEIYIYIYPWRVLNEIGFTFVFDFFLKRKTIFVTGSLQNVQ